MQTMQIRIKGRVQGVFYRQFTKDKAESLGINGTVQNCEDDSVEIIATGTKDQLDKLIEWCRKGPPRAVVTEVTIQELSLQPFKKFSIVRY
jgi:acylphosphatase